MNVTAAALAMAAMPLKAVFQGELPLTAQFRSGPRNPVKSYENWKKQQFLPEGFAPDLQTNVLRFAPENYEYANRFAAENPSMLIMSTWRAASGNPKGLDASGNGDPLGQSVIEFPGHFVLSPGSYLASSMSQTSTTVQVADGTKMLEGPALLVETNGSGEKLWEKFEYVLIQNVKGNTVTVKRAFNGSPSSRSFPKSTTYLAPMPWDFRVHADYTDWFFNLSENCPRDSMGRTAMDVIFADMIDPLRPGQPLDLIGGLDLASGPLNVNPTNADYDLDGLVDSETIYRAGVRRFYERVWAVLGEDRVLTTELDYEMLGFINGVNQEGLARPNDPWKEVSQTVNHVLAWQQISDLPMVSLAFVQYLNTEEDLKRVDMHRLLNGYSTCLGLAADVDSGDGIDALERAELFKGADKEQHWLGKSTGALMRPASLTPNLLQEDGSSSSTDWVGMLSNIETFRADHWIDGDELVIRPDGRGIGYTTLILNFDLARTSDLTILFEAISDDDSVVRNIKLPRISVPVETGAVRATISNLDYVPVGYLLRRAEAGSVMFDMRFQQGGDIRLRNLSVHATTDTLACEFERGVVLVNPSLDDVTLNLEEIFPHRTGYRRLTAPDVATSNIADKYLPQYELAMQLNNGQAIGNPKSVKIPERNALFLIADPANPTRIPTNSPTADGDTKSPTAFPTAYPTLTPTETPCEDSKNKFQLYPGAYVECWYVTRFPDKKDRRCSETTYAGPSVSDYCPRACDKCDEEFGSNDEDDDTVQTPPTSPVVSPPACQDSAAKFELTKGTFVKCTWTTALASAKARRCSETSFQGDIVSSICPKSCQACGDEAPSACPDSSDLFTLQSGASVKCVWTLGIPSKTSRRCAEKTKQGVTVSTLCPNSCGTSC